MGLIIIDGLDASGKSTQAELLTRRLVERGGSFIQRTHPSWDNFFGVRARGYLFVEGRSAHMAASLFYLVDVVRSVLLYRWRPVDHVIFVRYLMGTAYLPAPLHKLIYHLLSVLLPTSPHMFYIRVTPEEAYRRITLNRALRERFETLEELRRVSGKALSLASTGGWIIVDGDRPEGEVQSQILRHLGLDDSASVPYPQDE